MYQMKVNWPEKTTEKITIKKVWKINSFSAVQWDTSGNRTGWIFGLAPTNSCIFLFGSMSGLSFLATKYLSSNICSATDLEKKCLGKMYTETKGSVSFSEIKTQHKSPPYPFQHLGQTNIYPWAGSKAIALGWSRSCQKRTFLDVPLRLATSILLVSESVQ